MKRLDVMNVLIVTNVMIGPLLMTISKADCNHSLIRVHLIFYSNLFLEQLLLDNNNYLRITNKSSND
jgi:hypothetical protein